MIRAVLLALLVLAPPAAAQELCLSLKCLTGTFRHHTVVSGSMSSTLPPGACFSVPVRPPNAPPPEAGQIIRFTDLMDGMLHVFRMVAGSGQTVHMLGGILWIDGQPADRHQIDDFAQPMGRAPFGGLPRCPAPVAEGSTCAIPRFVETLPNGTSYEVLEIGGADISDWTDAFTVPQGDAVVPGDNRDNAFDSRFPAQAVGRGFVPSASIIGIFVMNLRE